MDDAAKVALQRVFRVLTEIGHPATNGVVFAIVRGAKLRFRNNEGKTLLAAMRADPGPLGVQFVRTGGPPEVQAGPPSRTRTRNKELSKPSLNGIVSSSEANASVGTGKPVAKTPEWVEKLREAVKAMQARDLPGLTPTERFTVARYCGVVYAYCNANETTNLRKARGIATSLSALCDYCERRGVTVRVGTFFRAASKFHERIGKPPWYTPFDAKTELVVKEPTA